MEGFQTKPITRCMQRILVCASTRHSSYLKLFWPAMENIDSVVIPIVGDRLVTRIDFDY